MKFLQSKYIWVITSFILFVGYWVGCTKNDQVLNLAATAVNSSELLSVKTTAPPVLDGAVDAMWANSPKLQFEAVVPDPGGDKFRSYVGNVTNVALRSVYDADNIYFLTEWADPTKSLNLVPWYFDTLSKTWLQENIERTFSPTGQVIREAFSEDKFGMLWNINNSVSGWSSATCYKSCHTGLSASDGFAAHRTNSPTEFIDQWLWRSAATNPSGQAEDMYQDNTYPDGMNSDVSTSGGFSDNLQTLVVTGTATSVTVPQYLIPGKTNYYWILGSEITDGTAKLITAVDANGVLTYSGGTIDPNTDPAFQRNGATTGAKCIPGIITSPFIGSGGDIQTKATFTGTGWIVEIKRALKTADAAHDVDFSSLNDQYFGFSVFDNRLGHAVKPNLLLRFQK